MLAEPIIGSDALAAFRNVHALVALQLVPFCASLAVRGGSFAVKNSSAFAILEDQPESTFKAHSIVALIEAAVIVFDALIVFKRVGGLASKAVVIESVDHALVNRTFLAYSECINLIIV